MGQCHWHCAEISIWGVSGHFMNILLSGLDDPGTQCGGTDTVACREIRYTQNIFSITWMTLGRGVVEQCHWHCDETSVYGVGRRFKNILHYYPGVSFGEAHNSVYGVGWCCQIIFLNGSDGGETVPSGLAWEIGRHL